MFDMGFEPQVMKIVGNIRPDAQKVLFSATFPKTMESLARRILSKPLEITVGGRSVVAPEIDQRVEIRDTDTKFTRLLQLLGEYHQNNAEEEDEFRTLIFVERQDGADDLFRELLTRGYVCASLHGGKEQVDRDEAITNFKRGDVPTIVATSVAARGLDVKELKLVIVSSPYFGEEVADERTTMHQIIWKITSIELAELDVQGIRVPVLLSLLRIRINSLSTFSELWKLVAPSFPTSSGTCLMVCPLLLNQC